MTDRVLLELAAKAAGVRRVIMNGSVGEVVLRKDYEDGGGVFDPLNDDGDALRLAVKLNLINKHSFLNTLGEETDMCDGDYYKATRRAIVRAAAEIGVSAK